MLLVMNAAAATDEKYWEKWVCCGMETCPIPSLCILGLKPKKSKPCRAVEGLQGDMGRQNGRARMVAIWWGWETTISPDL